MIHHSTIRRSFGAANGNERSISRRIFLAGSAGAAAVAAIGSRPSLAAERELKVATYGGSWQKAIENFIVPDIIKDGAKVSFFIGPPDSNLAKVVAAKRQGEVPFDVMDGTPNFYNDALKNNLISPIAYDKIPNRKDVPASVLDKAQVIVEWSPDCIVYNSQKLQEVGANPPKTYSDLMNNAKLKGRIAFPDVSHPQHWAAVVGLAREHGGSESDMNMVPALVKQIAPSYFYSNSTELSTRFASGEVWVAPWGAGWAVRLKRGGIPAAVSYAKFGDRVGALWPNIKWMIAGTPNSKLAHKYIDLWLGVEGPAKFCEATGTIPVNTKARNIMLKNDENRQMLLLTDQQIAKAYNIDWDNFDTKAWRDVWARNVQQ
jgi:spermidine/putrescine-binding protein